MCARQTTSRKFLRRAGIEEDGSAVDIENAPDAFELDLRRPAKRTPDRHTELVTLHVAESSIDQQLAHAAARLTERAVAIQYERFSFVVVHQALDRGHDAIRRSIERVRARNVTGDVLRAFARIQ